MTHRALTSPPTRWLATVVFLALASCTTGSSLDEDSDVIDDDPGPAETCTDEKIDTMFAAVCSMGGCHTATDRAAGLDLQSPDMVARISGQNSAACGPILVPGSSEDSLLVKVMVPAPECGPSMPPTLPLVPQDVECVASWIDSLPAAP